VKPYLAVEGLDLFVGSEPLALAAMKQGAAGAVSALASAWPEVVAALVHERSEGACVRVIDLRERLKAVPFHAALKTALVQRGILPRSDVRAPLRDLNDAERAIVLALGR
jgi:dihydrodipicolinate synthase/N-acetylneuraminate lyase